MDEEHSFEGQEESFASRQRKMLAVALSDLMKFTVVEPNSKSGV